MCGGGCSTVHSGTQRYTAVHCGTTLKQPTSPRPLPLPAPIVQRACTRFRSLKVSPQRVGICRFTGLLQESYATRSLAPDRVLEGAVYAKRSTGDLEFLLWVGTQTRTLVYNTDRRRGKRGSIPRSATAVHAPSPKQGPRRARLLCNRSA